MSIPIASTDADQTVMLENVQSTVPTRTTRGQYGEIEKAHAIYDCVFHNMPHDKSGTGWGRGDARWACDAHHRNCTDFHSLFISMAHSERIPARFEIGFPLPENLQEDRVPVDITEAWLDQKKYDYFFGTVDANRVRFSRGRDLTLAPKQSGTTVNYFVYPNVEVDGRPFQAVARFRFRNVGR
ncbi:MAG TPA: transglutaminase-like domain-containing protein [Terriglobia bacterium]|nr:transglutaminase-like domain-containing protein [Terriglobia bacterium]